MRGKRLAGPHRAVHHVVPLARIVEGAEHHAADEVKPVPGQRLAKERRVLGHEADGPELDAPVAGRRAFGEHLAPRRIARIGGKLDAPGAGRVADADGHGVGAFQSAETDCQPPVSAEAKAAAITRFTSIPSRKVGQTGSPVSMARRKSRASMMIWSW